jgi:hypothetical protein
MRARSPRRDRSKDRRRDKYERGSDTDSNAEHSSISPALLKKRRRRQLLCIIVGCSAVGTVFLQLGLITGFEMKGTTVRLCVCAVSCPVHYLLCCTQHCTCQLLLCIVLTAERCCLLCSAVGSSRKPGGQPWGLRRQATAQVYIYIYICIHTYALL